LALWIGQRLLCEGANAPCGTCQSCRYALQLTHPDLHWYFPRPRLKDSDPELADIREDYAEALADRAAAHGLYAPPSGSEGIYVATVRAIVQEAVMSPAVGKRKVFIIGDAERMVPQEGSEQAANAFLKLLEEPPADTTIVLTSSEPGALLPTIRSRVVSIRVPRVAEKDLREFLSDDTVARHLAGEDALPASISDRVAFSGGAPGRLLAAPQWARALENARRMLEAIGTRSGAGYEAAWAQAAAKARGSFADTLDALTISLHERARTAAAQADPAALGASRAIAAVETAKERVDGNASPQLITVNLIRELEALLT
jgi:DNA polymerase III subunit delta'